MSVFTVANYNFPSELQHRVRHTLVPSLSTHEYTHPHPRTTQLYGRLLFLLQTTPEYTARLIRLVSLKEIDGLLQIVMFSLYGNQFEDREEHLLLSMFEVSLCIHVDIPSTSFPCTVWSVQQSLILVISHLSCLLL